MFGQLLHLTKHLLHLLSQDIYLVTRTDRHRCGWLQLTMHHNSNWRTLILSLLHETAAQCIHFSSEYVKSLAHFVTHIQQVCEPMVLIRPVVASLRLLTCIMTVSLRTRCILRCNMLLVLFLSSISSTVIGHSASI